MFRSLGPSDGLLKVRLGLGKRAAEVVLLSLASSQGYRHPPGALELPTLITCPQGPLL